MGLKSNVKLQRDPQLLAVGHRITAYCAARQMKGNKLPRCIGKERVFWEAQLQPHYIWGEALDTADNNGIWLSRASSKGG